jgi:hypothetical protein
MSELEQALVALGRQLDFPPEPDLAAAVRARIARRRFSLGRREGLALAFAVLLVAVGIAMAVPDARSAILRFFHVGAATVERVETLPPARERPLAAGLGPALGRTDAERRAGFRISLPKGRAPSRFYAEPGLIAALLSYRGTSFLFAELDGDQMVVSKKYAPFGTRVEPVQVNGAFGLWLAGAPHVIRFERPSGVTQLPTRLAGNTLLWARGGYTFRLEGRLDLQTALHIARTVS